MNVGSHVNCMWRIGASQIDRSTGMGNEAYAAAHITMMGEKISIEFNISYSF